jgi:hypothetical protein
MPNIATLIVMAGLIPAGAATAPSSEPNAPFTTSPETTSVLGPVRPDGSIDYVAAINQHFSQGVTPENNGFVLWLRVMGSKGIPQSVRTQMLAMCGAEIKPTDIGWTDYARNTPLERGSIRLWKAQDDPEYVAFLKSREDLLDIATEAAARPRWWEPSVSSNGSVFMILLPELSSMRSVASALCDRALLRAQQGDFDGFLADVVTAKRLARSSSCGFIVGDLVATSIDVLADRTLAAAAGAGIFSADQATKLGSALDGLTRIPPISESVDVGERWAMLDWTESIATGNVQRLSESGSDSDRWTRMFKAVDRDSVDWNAVLQQFNGDFDETIRIMKLPPGKDQQIARRNYDRKLATMKANSQERASLAKQAGESNQAYTDHVADAILSVLSASLWRAQDTCRSGEMEGEMARAVVAAAEYRADKGKWPDKLEDLMPDYLSELPKAIFDQDGTRPVRYQKTARGICLHARGLKGQDIVVGAE